MLNKHVQHQLTARWVINFEARQTLRATSSDESKDDKIGSAGTRTNCHGFLLVQRPWK